MKSITRRHLPSPILLASIMVLLCATTSCSRSGSEVWTRELPSGIHVNRVLNGSISDAVMSRSGFVVFELSDDTAAAIERAGIHAIEKHVRPRSAPWRRPYSRWRETPVYRAENENPSRPSGQDLRALGELNCQEVKDGSFLDSYGLCEALEVPGNYYARGGYDDLLLIIPRRKIVVYAVQDF